MCQMLHLATLSINSEPQLHSFLMFLNFQMQYLLFKSKFNYLNLMLNYPKLTRKQDSLPQVNYGQNLNLKVEYIFW